MGIGVSKANKIEVESLKTYENQKKVHEQNSVPQSRHNAANGKAVRFSNDGAENNAKTAVRCVPVVVNNTSNRPKFYYYPKRKESTTKETIFLPTSQFPYKKAKAVYVRQRNTGLENPVAANQRQQVHGTFEEKWKFGRYENSTGGMSDVQNDRMMYRSVAKQAYRPHQSFTERHWSTSHLVPTNKFQSDRILPNRAVAELRRSSISCLDADPNFFTGDELRRHSVEIEPGVNRPPTPSPTAWYPTRRTEDYLMASSLLAGEREMDRRLAVGRDVHDF